MQAKRHRLPPSSPGTCAHRLDARRRVRYRLAITRSNGTKFMPSPSPLFDLTGKTALITGSSLGIGRGLAKGMQEAGATIVVNGRNAERLTTAADELRGDGGNDNLNGGEGKDKM